MSAPNRKNGSSVASRTVASPPSGPALNRSIRVSIPGSWSGATLTRATWSAQVRTVRTSQVTIGSPPIGSRIFWGSRVARPASWYARRTVGAKVRGVTLPFGPPVHLAAPRCSGPTAREGRPLWAGHRPRSSDETGGGARPAGCELRSTACSGETGPATEGPPIDGGSTLPRARGPPAARERGSRRSHGKERRRGLGKEDDVGSGP